MWVLRMKTDAEGRLERRKTRLVIKRFQQREGIDFQDVFAPVSIAPTLRLLLAAAAVCGWKVEQMDVKTAFLYGVVDEEIYMKQPEGYDDGSGRVCRLNQAIYGLKQAPRCWYARLVEALEALGFKVSGCDESLFMTKGEEEKVFLLVYVNDILLFSPSLERIKEVQGKLQGPWTSGVLPWSSRGAGRGEGMSRTLRWFEIQFSTTQPTPLIFDHRLTSLFPDKPSESSGPYAELVGCLMYLMTCTRPDLAFPLSVLSRFVATGRHRPIQWTAAVRVAKYPATTSGMGLVLGGTQPVELTGHCDSSYADDVETQRSTQGYCFSLGAGAVSWRSTRSS
ncbi:unnamed protein product [Closterium sp. NIES-54]